MNEWTGVIVYGCVRDSVKLSEIKLGVKALNTNPEKSNKKNEGQENIPVSFGGVMFSPGDYVYCDADGIVVAKEML
jgi:regulator of ribonuclease activity A